MAEKKSRKELNQPDQLVNLTQRALQWVTENRKVLVLGFVALALVIVATYGWRWYSDMREMQASLAFIEARKILDARIVERPESDQTTQGDGTYPSEAERARAAIVGLEKVLQNHPGTRTASLATYFIAESRSLLGEYDKAVEGFSRYLREEGPRGELARFAIEGIGASLEGQGKYDEAKEQYRRLTEPPFDAELDRGLYHIARMEQKAGNSGEAARQFKEIVEKHPKSAFQREIEDRLAFLSLLNSPEGGK